MAETNSYASNSALEKVLNERSVSVCGKQIKQLVPRLSVAYTDVDGTMVGPHGCFFLDSGHQHTLEPAKALLKAQSRDIDIVLVSGRNLSQLLNDARLLGIKNYIAEMGCQIAHDWGSQIIETVPAPEGKTIYQGMIDSGAVALLLGHFKGTLEHHTPWSEARECTGVFRGFINVDEANDLLDKKGLSHFELVDNGSIIRKSPTLTVSDLKAYHLVPRGISKSSAVAKDLELRNIPKGESIALGDAEADLTFAPQVGAFFLVKNGLLDNRHLAEEILQTPNVFVTESEMGRGWAEVLNLFTE